VRARRWRADRLGPVPVPPGTSLSALEPDAAPPHLRQRIPATRRSFAPRRPGGPRRRPTLRSLTTRRRSRRSGPADDGLPRRGADPPMPAAASRASPGGSPEAQPQPVPPFARRRRRRARGGSPQSAPRAAHTTRSPDGADLGSGRSAPLRGGRAGHRRTGGGSDTTGAGRRAAPPTGWLDRASPIWSCWHRLR
jgi:hypothetical protein